MSDSITIPKEEYDFLKSKAELFDKYIETEQLSDEEIAQIKKALKGPFLTEKDFFKKHPEFA